MPLNSHRRRNRGAGVVPAPQYLGTGVNRTRPRCNWDQELIIHSSRQITNILFLSIHRNTPVGETKFMMYYKHLEYAYQEDVEQNTFPVKLTNQKVYMKHTKATIKRNH